MVTKHRKKRGHTKLPAGTQLKCPVGRPPGSKNKPKLLEAKRPVGRPPGSKNKPKTPAIGAAKRRRGRQPGTRLEAIKVGGTRSRARWKKSPGTWYTVLRLPDKAAKRLKRKAKALQTSVNAYLVSMVDVFLAAEAG